MFIRLRTQQKQQVFVVFPFFFSSVFLSLRAASDRSLSHLLSCPFNPSWATPLLALHCNVNVVLSARGTNMPGTMAEGAGQGGVDMHLIYASIIAFDDVDNYVALCREFLCVGANKKKKSINTSVFTVQLSRAVCTFVTQRVHAEFLTDRC